MSYNVGVVGAAAFRHAMNIYFNNQYLICRRWAVCGQFGYLLPDLRRLYTGTISIITCITYVVDGGWTAWGGEAVPRPETFVHRHDLYHNLYNICRRWWLDNVGKLGKLLPELRRMYTDTISIITYITYAVDGGWAAWGSWGSCSQSCDVCTQARSLS